VLIYIFSTPRHRFLARFFRPATEGGAAGIRRLKERALNQRCFHVSSKVSPWHSPGGSNVLRFRKGQC
jgi:hypothetical protein